MASADFKSDCRNYFCTDDLYQIFVIDKNASPKEVKKAYHRLSLIIHPDRNKLDKENNTKKFQLLSQAYAILSDENKRAVYDETGCISDDDLNLPECNNWTDYWKSVFPPFSEESINDFKNKYRGSDREKENIKSLYNTHTGDFTKILKNHLLFECDEEERVRLIIQNLIDTGELTPYKAFTHEPKSKKEARKRFWRKQHAEYEKEMKKRKTSDNDESSLTKQLLATHQNRIRASENFLDNLAEKYASKSKKANKKKK